MKVSYQNLKEQYNYVIEKVFELHETIDYLESLGTYFSGYKTTAYKNQLKALNARAKEIDTIIYEKYINHGHPKICNTSSADASGAETILQNSSARCAQQE